MGRDVVNISELQDENITKMIGVLRGLLSRGTVVVFVVLPLFQ